MQTTITGLTQRSVQPKALKTTAINFILIARIFPMVYLNASRINSIVKAFPLALLINYILTTEVIPASLFSAMREI